MKNISYSCGILLGVSGFFYTIHRYYYNINFKQKDISNSDKEYINKIFSKAYNRILTTQGLIKFEIIGEYRIRSSGCLHRISRPKIFIPYHMLPDGYIETLNNLKDTNYANNVKLYLTGSKPSEEELEFFIISEMYKIIGRQYMIYPFIYLVMFCSTYGGISGVTGSPIIGSLISILIPLYIIKKIKRSEEFKSEECAAIKVDGGFLIAMNYYKRQLSTYKSMNANKVTKDFITDTNPKLLEDKIKHLFVSKI